MRPLPLSVLIGSTLFFSSTSFAAMTIKYQHTDVLGSVIAETNANGQVIKQTKYHDFGEQKGGQQAGLGYTGHLEDPDLGLTYMQQRYYDPVIGRFYSNDPVGFNTDNLMMFNRYAYANNNPYKYVDPDGRETNPVSGKSGIADSEVRTNSTNPNVGKFGDTRSSSNWNKGNHSGTDIAAAKGTALVAPISGTVTVITADKNKKGGNTLFIEKNVNGKSVKIGMSHLDSISVADKSKVTEGQSVGTSGTTGNAEGLPKDEEHVHVSVKIDGVAVDPQKHFNDNPSSQEEKK